MLPEAPKRPKSKIWPQIFLFAVFYGFLSQLVTKPEEKNRREEPQKLSLRSNTSFASEFVFIL